MTSYIGIDVGKKSLHVYMPVIDKSFEVTNNTAGFNKLISYLIKHYQTLSSIIIVFEPTGGYERVFRELLKANKVHFTTVHPNKVRAYAKAKGLLAKTDKIDSKLIADYATAFSLPVKRDYNTASRQHLHALIQRREQLIVIKNQESNRLEVAYDQFIITAIKKHITYLDKQLELTEIAIKELCRNDLELRDKLKALTSIPGVGMVLATKAITTVPELGQIDSNKLTALTGLAPYARDSGCYKGKRSIFAGKSNLRKVLYMAAVASLRCNQKLKSFYDRLIANHKPPKVALVAVMRKLLSFMNAILKNNSSWNNNYVLI
jgi:transposase